MLQNEGSEPIFIAVPGRIRSSLLSIGWQHNEHLPDVIEIPEFLVADLARLHGHSRSSA